MDDGDRVRDPQEELEPAEHKRVEVLEEQRREEEQTEVDVDEERPQEKRTKFERVLGFTQAAFRGDELDTALEHAEDLSKDERQALALLQEVIRGREDVNTGLIYAEERMEMLEHVLAVLQPTLAMGLSPELAELRDGYDQLVEEVTELRDELKNLEDAQEELFEHEKEAFAEAPDTDDKPDEKAAEAHEVDGAPLPSTLEGKPGDKPVEKPAQPSTLAGKPGEPAVEKPATPSTLAGKPGDKPVEPPAAKSTVWDGES